MPYRQLGIEEPRTIFRLLTAKVPVAENCQPARPPSLDHPPRDPTQPSLRREGVPRVLPGHRQR